MLKHTQVKEEFIDDALSHFYFKNTVDYPEYEFKGRELPNLKDYRVKEEDQTLVMGHKNIRMPTSSSSSPNIELKNR